MARACERSRIRVQGPGGQVNDARHFADLAALGEQLIRLAEPGRPLECAGLLSSAVRAVPRAAHAGVTVLGRRGRPDTFCATDELPAQIDALQHTLGDGPFLHTVGGEEIVHIGDVLTDPRCRSFGQQCAEEFGVRSILSVAVAMSGVERAALSMYATTPAAFDNEDIATASAVAPFLGLAVQSALHARKVEQLEIALQNSRQIGTAVGILMARHLLTADEAFARMSRASQQLNRKLREIAEWVQRTGTLPLIGPDGVASDGHGPVGVD